MQRLMKHMCIKFTRFLDAEEAFQPIKTELCEKRVIGLPKKMACMF